MRGAARLVVLLGLGCGWGCGCSSVGDLDFGTWAWERPAHQQGGGASEARYGACSGSCPAAAPVACGDLCCAAGATCTSAGCAVPALAAKCGSGETLCSPCTGAGCALADASSRGNDATARDVTLLGAGRFNGGALPYAKDGDCTEAGALTAPTSGFPSGGDPMTTGGDPLTIELWVRVPASAAPESGEVPLITWGSDDGLRALTMESGTLHFRVGSLECSTSLPDPGVWAHVVATWDGSAPWNGTSVKVYVNAPGGVTSISTPCADTGTPPVDTTSLVYLGPAPQYSPTACGDLAPADLVIDEVRVSAGVRSKEEITADTAGPLTADAATVALWHFDTGVSCCPSGAACDDPRCTGAPACPADAPVACGTGCCPAGASCLGGDQCLVAGPRVDSQPCCPGSHPVECGSTCCLEYADCNDDGTCGCPADETPCGAYCCGEDASCVDGECRVAAECPNADYPTPCGADLCCRAGVACVDGQCPCGDEYPEPCGDICCLPGGGCEDTYCSCPADRPPCGFSCCDPGQYCVDGLCQDSPGGGGETCPGGWMASIASYVPLGSGGSCTGGGDRNHCLTEAEFTAASGLPLPAACNPEGSGGCIDTTTGILVHPCCPGLACRVTDVCGQSPLLSGGTCQQ